MMLTEEEKEDIEVELQRYKFKRAACIEALRIVQQHRGWVSDQNIKDTAEFLEMTPDEVDSVATFYNLIYKKPVGKHVILICNSISCWVTGYDLIYEHLKARLGIDLGETSSDGLFTLLPVACLGACDHAPAMMIDKELYVDLNPQKIDEILKEYRERT
ncbi:MAG: NADH-quinone oxidoreductase subunit NuoE [Nitrospirota bacterium]